MNVHDPRPPLDGDLAQLEYGDAEFRVIRPGRYVLCAVSGLRIPVDALRYWNPALQEAYAGPREALARWRELQADA